MASSMTAPGIQSPQPEGGHADQSTDYYPGLKLNGSGNSNPSRPESADSPALSSAAPNGQPASSTSPPPQPVSNTQKPHAPTPQQTPVPVPVIPGQQANHVLPPLVSSDIGQQTQSPSPAPTANSASAPPAGTQLPPDIMKTQTFSTDYTKLCQLMKECAPDAVRRAVRDNFEKCMLGSAYHIAFIMNVVMHRAENGVLSRAVRDFGSKIVAEGKVDIAKWLKTEDLDEISDVLLQKASNQFLDKALVMRLPSIEARRLVNALARAERLGYDKNDIVENEHVIPTAVPGGPPAGAPALTRIAQPNPPPMPQPAQAERTRFVSPYGPPPKQPEDPNHLKCNFCHRVFERLTAWSHHVKKRVCIRPYATLGASGHVLLCPHCGQSFGAHYGLQYHMMNKVCGDFGPVTKEDCQNVKTIPGPTGFRNELNKRPTGSPPAQYSGSNNSPAASQMPVSSTPQAQSQPAPQATPESQVTPGATIQFAGIQKPPLGTPQAKDMAHLTQSQVYNLLQELRRAEEDFKDKIAHAKASGLAEAEVEKKLQSYRNSYACKQSTVRKKYGIRLRERRGRAEMDAERHQMGYGAGPRQGTPGDHRDKRARLNNAGDSAVTSTQETTPSQHAPVKQVAVADIGGGLTGSNATAATEDPTLSMSQPPRSSQAETSRPSSLRIQGNHRVEIHVPSPSTKKMVADGPNGASSGSSPSKQQGAGLTAQELLRQMRGDVQVIDDSSSSDSDSDSESDSDSDSDSGTDDGNGGRGIKSEPPA